MNQQSPAATVFRRQLLVSAAILGAIAVVAGAFGAHALSARVPAKMLDVWATGVRYQMWHVLALLAAGALFGRLSDRTLRAAGIAWIAGIILFCGSLYLLVLTGNRTFGAATPVGGLFLVAGWVLFALAAWRGADVNTDQ